MNNPNPPDRPTPDAAARLTAEIERFEEEETAIESEMSALLLRGREMRHTGASDADVSEINDRLAVLRARRRALPLPCEMTLLRQQRRNAEHGWTLLPDGTYAKALPNGRVLSAWCGVTEMQDSDGTVYRETPEDRRRQADHHRPHVIQFKADVAGARLAAARRGHAGVRPTRAGRSIVRGRGRSARRCSPGSVRAGPSGDDPHEPGGDDPPPRDTGLLLRDVADYLGRLGPLGAERDWLIDQLAYLGYSHERVGAAFALAVGNRQARRGRGAQDDADDVDVIWGARS